MISKQFLLNESMLYITIETIYFQQRWSRGRSKERGYHHAHAHGHHDGEPHDSDGNDYAADNSSEHSSSATQSPRHRPVPYGDSPLARTHYSKLDKCDSLTSQNDSANIEVERSSITVAQVRIHKHTHTLLGRYDTSIMCLTVSKIPIFLFNKRLFFPHTLFHLLSLS